jgi:TolB-like protein
MSRASLFLCVCASVASARLAFSQCPDGTPPPCGRSVATPAANSVAVLYFDSRGTDSADAYLADGLTEEIITRLQQVRRLAVASRYASQRVRGEHETPATLGRLLHARFLVGGSVQRAAGRLVVRVELLRADREQGVWAERYDRTGDDLLTLVDEIARAVATGVAGELLPGERTSLARGPTRNNEAYRLFLFANTLMARRTAADTRRAIAAYGDATRLDPRFAAAWARLGYARGIQWSWHFPDSLASDSVLARARSATERALELDSLSADAWLAHALVRINVNDLAGAHHSFERSLARDSLNAEAFHLYGFLYGCSEDANDPCLDDLAAAAPLFRRALALDPDRRITWYHFAYPTLNAGRLADAEAMCDSALARGPWPPAYIQRAYARFLRGNGAGALADLVAAGAIDSLLHAQDRALVSIAIGDSTPAREALTRLRAQADSGRPALPLLVRFSMALGLHEEALAAVVRLRRLTNPDEPRCSPTAFCSASNWAWRALRDPIFAPLHGDPRYQRLVEETRPRVPWLTGAGGSNR